MIYRPGRIFVVLALVFSAAVGGSVAAQGAAASSDVLSALLVEVRGLRAAMEQMASAGPRIELALGRLQLQEQRVNNLLRRHTEVCERLTAAERETETASRRMEELQEMAREPSEEPRRSNLLYELRQVKNRHAQMTADLQRLRAEESEAAQLLGLEQGRWTEINQRLEELERTLTRK